MTAGELIVMLLSLAWLGVVTWLAYSGRALLAPVAVVLTWVAAWYGVSAAQAAPQVEGGQVGYVSAAIATSVGSVFAVAIGAATGIAVRRHQRGKI
jgi:hypothetical protein